MNETLDFRRQTVMTENIPSCFWPLLASCSRNNRVPVKPDTAGRSVLGLQYIPIFVDLGQW